MGRNGTGIHFLVIVVANQGVFSFMASSSSICVTRTIGHILRCPISLTACEKAADPRATTSVIRINYQECFRLIKMAQEKIPDTQEGAYWIYYMEGIMREGSGIPEYGLKNPFYNIQKAEEAYLKAYRIYMKYGDKNQAEPYIVILKSLAELYYTQGDKQKEMDVYRLIEQRVPASIIRDEIHAEADNEVRSGLDEDIVIRFGFDNENS